MEDHGTTLYGIFDIKDLYKTTRDVFSSFNWYPHYITSPIGAVMNSKNMIKLLFKIRVVDHGYGGPG